MERWLPIEGFPGYEVSDQGRVRCWRPRTHTAKAPTEPRLVASTPAPPGGYLMVQLCTGDGRQAGKRVHRLVLETFVGPSNGLDACHLNGVRTDNRLENLRWDTRKGNFSDKKLHGTSGKVFTPYVETFLLYMHEHHGVRYKDLGFWFSVTPQCTWQGARAARARRAA